MEKKKENVNVYVDKQLKIINNKQQTVNSRLVGIWKQAQILVLWVISKEFEFMKPIVQMHTKTWLVLKYMFGWVKEGTKMGL